MSRSVELGDRLGEGRTAEVYAVADDSTRAVKLYERGADDAVVDREATYSRVAVAAGVAAPEVFGTVDVDGRRGIVLERVDGPHLADRMRERPWAVVEAARTAAGVHRRMHDCDGGDLPSLGERLRRRVEAGAIGVRQREGTLTVLDALPAGDALCHGDFHPENVLLRDGEPVVIDWVDAAAGHPAADVARSSLLLRLAVADDDYGPFRAGYFRGLVETYRRTYLRSYLDGAGFDRELVERYELPVAAARLTEGVPSGEERRLRDRIGDLLDRYG
ncbi:phosphotransferase family protein [Halobium salinum]|uniref:Phosphotransferase family protein n=1 Tax=Halobium salinum TaxID=1364940 RepID=A0ABD5PF39_9EURY|nr:phosphotransferase [Halobium salinum]